MKTISCSDAGWRWVLVLTLVVSCGAAAQKNPPPPVFVGTPPPTPALVPESSPTSAPAPPPAAPARRSLADLEKLAAPIALYPDPVISVILPASVYPVEIVQAARFVKDTNNIAKIDQQSWDNSVKAVAKIPPVITQMDTNLDWTIQLGQAFLEQPMDLMNAIQALRSKAQTAGTLKTTPEQVVTTTNAVVERTYEGQVVYVTNTVIQVQPANSDVIYVPTYNPSTVYVGYDAVAASVVSFGFGIAFGAAWWGNCDWNYGGCYWGAYAPPPPYYPPPYYPPAGGARPPPATAPRPLPPPNSPPATASPSTPSQRPTGASRPAASTLSAQRWQPDQNRLSTFGAPSAATRETRGWGTSSTQPAPLPATSGGASRPSPWQSAASGGNRPATGTLSPANWPGASATARQTPALASSRPSATFQRPSASRSTPSSVGAPRSSSAPTFSRPSAQSSSGFRGMSSSSGARSFSSRGASSLGSGGGGGSRGGGGRVR